ncbi:NAD-dependent epimerase/dehydratase family protein [Hartmannibacter diazotrophicus]|uniref:NAD-dependent epimerase/dehydratase family protein n=1 Tax=Hartmannibacter diazotrophicus TaxID=1482074 RepID=A0A2C9DAJ9_9HYPH|nr:NAD(P)-dependent oxidoreductase [Hartmannibacter diazotrophicus]SON57286.1 NAD-dependent epimerase/dehydratase family protein [Hartmannibacter diazotrophicus]
MKLLVTGAAGKVGQAFLPAFLNEQRFGGWEVVALCHNRAIATDDRRVSVVHGSMADEETVASALRGVSHVLHLAAVKESPDLAIDVALKGLYLLLEQFRLSSSGRQFLLLSGDCVVGHIFQDYAAPITEASQRRAYPGIYALTKVLEEVMLEQFGIQHGLKHTILRAPWIMEKDDFRYAFEMGEAQFGGPPWETLIDSETLAKMRDVGVFPAMRDANGGFLKRSFIHVDDLVEAILLSIDNPDACGELFNIAMNEPADYGRISSLVEKNGWGSPVEIKTPFHSNWLDNTKARKVLGWTPAIDLEGLVERAWNYRREDNDPRIVWYPG